MNKANALKEASNESLVAELQLRVPQLPDALKQQLSAALAEKTRPQVEGTLSATENAIPKAHRIPIWGRCARGSYLKGYK
jgi:hypothetical protein